jgi:hypothetical protein
MYATVWSHHYACVYGLLVTDSGPSCRAMQIVRVIQRPIAQSVVQTAATTFHRVTPDVEMRKRLSTEPARKRLNINANKHRRDTVIDR